VTLICVDLFVVYAGLDQLLSYSHRSPHLNILLLTGRGRERGHFIKECVDGENNRNFYFTDGWKGPGRLEPIEDRRRTGELMKRHWIEYTAAWKPGPMSFWVHIEEDSNQWYRAEKFSPPKPKPVTGKGYANFIVEIDSATLCFASVDEIQVCIETLSQKALPSNMIMAAKRGTKSGAKYGPNNHWLNRIPLRSMAWPYRQRVVKYLKVTLRDFKREIVSSLSS